MKTLLTIIAATLFALTAQAETLTLAWLDNSDNELGFKVERSIDGEDFVEIGSVGENVETYEDQTVEIGITYTYRVRAFNDGGTSGYSNTASATVVDPKYGEPFEPDESPGGLGVRQFPSD